MKNKFLALAAFGTAILGGAILSAPASAQIASGSQTKPIAVNVTVPEILFLRTITTANVAITPTDLVGAAGAGMLTPVAASATPAYEGSDQTTGSVLNTLSPFAVAAAPVLKTIPSAYIVWSNSPTGFYEVDIAPGTFASGANNLTVAISGSDVSNGTIAAEGLTTATPRNIDLDVTLNATAPAGTYAGVLTVDAFRP